MSVATKALWVVAASALVLALASPLLAQNAEEDATGFVYVVKPGKTALRGEAKMEAAPKGQVSYGQKLSLKKKIKVGEEVRWLQVNVPGDPALGWIPANVVLDKRPAVEHQPVSGAAFGKVVANENSTAAAIRGLDGRAIAYAKYRQIRDDVLVQTIRLEAHGEALFSDRHSVDPAGAWRYPDATAPGRVNAAQTFAQAEGLRAKGGTN